MKPTNIIFSSFLLFIGYVVYFLFVRESKEIFDFRKLNPNDQKNVEVRVYLEKDQEIFIDPLQNVSIFFVRDKNNEKYKVQGPSDVPEGFREAEIVIMRGHLHHDYFHASSIIGVE